MLRGLDLASRERSNLGSDRLQQLSKRKDARVILVAGGEEKRRIVKQVLEAGLCNVLITDVESARHLKTA